jgi:Cu+-exporting ATPase
MEKDPVCGMAVDRQNAAGQSEYQGKTYYFCSLSCKEEFEKQPDQFTNLLANQEIERNG